MIRSISFVAALVCALCVAQGAHATTLNVNLDLEFNNPFNVNSGGTWTVSALAGDFGLAGITFDILPANFSGDFLISDTIFEVQEFLSIGGGLGFDIVTGDDLDTPTLNVGVGGSGVELVTGTFDPGDVPALSDLGANLFNESGVAVEVSEQNLTTSLATNIVPEPTALGLLSLAVLGAVASSRRRA